MVHLCVFYYDSYSLHSPFFFNIRVSFALSTVPPRIEQFSFRENMSEGMRTRVVCGVYEGDQPLTLTWLREGQPLQLTGQPGTQVMDIDHFSSVLTLGPLTQELSGRYACRAANGAAVVQASAELVVNGKVVLVLHDRRDREE